MKLASKLPKGDANGLTEVHAAMVEHPTSTHIVVGVVDCVKITRDTDDGSVEATARVRRVEVLGTTELRGAGIDLLVTALNRRQGGDVLPFDVLDIRAAMNVMVAYGDDATWHRTSSHRGYGEVLDPDGSIVAWVNLKTGELLDEEPTDEPESDEDDQADDDQADETLELVDA